MIRHYDFATGQIVDDDEAQADSIRAADTTTRMTSLRLLTVDEAASRERPHRRRLDHVIRESVIADLEADRVR